MPWKNYLQDPHENLIIKKKTCDARARSKTVCICQPTNENVQQYFNCLLLAIKLNIFRMFGCCKSCQRAEQMEDQKVEESIVGEVEDKPFYQMKKQPTGPDHNLDNLGFQNDNDRI